MRSVEEIISELRRFGLQLFVKDGTVHGRMPDGRKMPLEARQLAEELRLYNDAAVRILEAERPIQKVVMRTVDEARAWKAKIEAGEIEMIGQVVYNDADGSAVMQYRKRVM